MNVRHTLPVVAAVLALGASAAFATPMQLTGTFTVTEQYSSGRCDLMSGSNCGGPTISDDLNGNLSHDGIYLTAGGPVTTSTALFTAAPYRSCTGGGCTVTDNPKTEIETDALTITFDNLALGGTALANAALAGMGTFEAEYKGAELACAVGDGVGASSDGQSDCVLWGSTTSYSGYEMLTDNLNLGPGQDYDLDIYLYNATDWDIRSQIGFALVAVPSTVPEPATLALFAAGLAALGWAMSRRRNAN